MAPQVSAGLRHTPALQSPRPSNISSKFRCPSISCLCTSRSTLYRKSRKQHVSVRAFRLDNERLVGVAKGLPSPFNTESTLGQTTKLFSERVVYHGSSWELPRVKAEGRYQLRTFPGIHPYLDDVDAWRQAYSCIQVHNKGIVADDTSRDAFVLTISDIQNTGPFLGKPPSSMVSHMISLHHLRFDLSGRLSEVWLTRNGTLEECNSLLKEGSIRPTFHWLNGFGFYPVNWQVDSIYTAHILDQTNLWLYDVMTKQQHPVMDRVTAPDVVYYDCLGLTYPRPVIGSRAVRDVYMDRSLRWDVQATVPLSIVAQEGGNKVFVHWLQSLTRRTDGLKSSREGMTVLVFDHQGRAVSILDWCMPTLEERVAIMEEVVMA